MKNQHNRTQARNNRFATVAISLLMLVAMLSCFTIFASAQNAGLSLNDFDFSALELDETTGVYYKEYDGTDAADVTLTAAAKDRLSDIFEGTDGDLLEIVSSAKFDASDITATSILLEVNVVAKSGASVSDDLIEHYQALLPRSFSTRAQIMPKTIGWVNSTVEVEVDYVPGQTTYSSTITTFPALNMTNAPTVVAPNGIVATVSGVNGAETKSTIIGVPLNNPNYIAEPLTVEITVNPLVIDSIVWDNFNDSQYVFEWSDEAILHVGATGYVGDTGYKLDVVLPEGYGDVGTHELVATVRNGFSFSSSVVPSIDVQIKQKTYRVTMLDKIFLGNDGLQGTATKYLLVVEGVDGMLPAAVLEKISYTVDGNAFTGTTAYGKYTVVASWADSENFKFVDANNQPITSLTAVMYVNRQYIPAGTSDAPYQFILYGEDGFTGEISATVTIPEKLNRRAIAGLRVHKEYKLTINGGEGETFTVMLPIEDVLLNARCDDLTVNDLYIYEEATGEMVRANEKGYTVTLKDGYYQIENFAGDSAAVFVIAPVYHTPFWQTALGIALIVLIILLVIVALYLIGMYLRRVNLSRENEEMTVDTEGDVPEVVDVEIEDKTDADEAIDSKLDELAGQIDPEVEEEENTEGTEEAVAESMQELMDEVSEISLEDGDETDPTDGMADQKAEELQDVVDAADADAEADADALRAAVGAAMAENFNESADATEAIALVAMGTSVEDFKAIVDAIVADSMATLVEAPEAEEEEVAPEAVVEEAVVEEAVEETAEEAVAEEAVEETAEEVTEEAAEEAVAEEATEEAVEAEPAPVVEEMSEDDVRAIVSESVSEAFEMATVDGAAPDAVEGTTMETITETVNAAGDAHIPETWAEDMASNVKMMVAAELAARLLEEDDGDSFDFGDMDLEFIDVMEEPEKYQQMLQEESEGLVRLVTRYRRSFQSRLAQSQGNVQNYYNEIKNALLSYKGVKNRISWNYEAFNRGRVHVAKINAKTKTLYLYLALDPAELAETKYGVVDMSSKKKYASVPVLMKIKGDRKFKYALELIDKLCGENLTLQKLEAEAADYRLPYQTTEELVQARLVKKLVASIPMVYSEAPVEETPTEASPATEEQEVTFIAPSDAPAVEAATEELTADAPAENEEGPTEV